MTVHQFFCILLFWHTCSLCRVDLVVQFPARCSTQVLLCLFPGVVWLWHFLYSVGPHPVLSLYVYTFFVLWAFMAGAASQAGDADSSSTLVSPLVCRGPWMSTVVLYCWCHSISASVLLYFTFKSSRVIIKWHYSLQPPKVCAMFTPNIGTRFSSKLCANPEILLYEILVICTNLQGKTEIIWLSPIKKTLYQYK